ncbi:ABC transporter permease subunit [Enterococcus cecorum]|uniref:carbohydrate ABC transporter permease n=1 Tax=Enterococcus cecorum TaxID=44008 RepID=UPI0022D20B52|nr:carbohydrate ABC transporter permease [Enterococcus cecorum]MDY2953993.1 carbohydrate ABC transporter permease [Enterococcus cecorum]CAI3251232.1 ABC transporter permease subunit [Enterococcus cecorum]CAI3325663.1 ABC transporter permease subunit [Enterococcus cecorum]
MTKEKKRDRRIKIVLGVALLIGAIVWLLPFIWMILSSLKTDAEIMKFPPKFLPEHASIESFRELFNAFDFSTYLKNTVIIVLFSFLGMFFNAMAGFGFAKYDFKGREFFFYLVLATMMIPGQVTMIPVYLIMNSLQLTNSMVGIILPGLVGAYGIFLFRQFISTVSNELIEAARLDGASEWFIFSKIILPISKPVLAVQGIATFIAGWNSFLWPLIMANDEKYYTLSVGLQLLKGQYANNYSLQMAGSTFMVVPILIVFMFLQKYILDGYNVSGNK